MPCSIYKGSQRRLCFATKEWLDWSGIKEVDSKIRAKVIKKDKLEKGGKIRNGK